MGRWRYRIEDERVEGPLLGDGIESSSDLETGRSITALEADYPDALERACAKLGITLESIEDELEDHERSLDRHHDFKSHVIARLPETEA